MNPIEQIWKETRKRGFKNEVFQTLQKVVDRLCDTICSLSNKTIKSIAGREIGFYPAFKWCLVLTHLYILNQVASLCQ